MIHHIHQRLLAVAISAAFTVFLFGCDSTESRKSELEQEAGKYYRAYLDGDVTQARQSLQQLIQCYQSPQAEILGPSSQAHSLFCAYGRLFVLEKRAVDKDDAEVALTRARYWHLQSYELSEDGWRTREKLHEFLSYQTPDWFEDTMSKLDQGANHGSGPKYIQYLPHTQPNKSPEPTAVGAVSSAVAVHVTSRRWLSFFR
jgi:hypothetical protein